MANFKVIYEIEIEAEDAVDAALEVEDIMGDYNGENHRPFFEITNTETNETETVDLEDY